MRVEDLQARRLQALGDDAEQPVHDLVAEPGVGTAGVEQLVAVERESLHGLECPRLEALAATHQHCRPAEFIAGFDWPRPDKRREFLRVRRKAGGTLDLFPNQGSGVLTSLAWADGLVDNPPGQPIARGDRVRFIALEDLL